MLSEKHKRATDNNPDIIVTLVADGIRAPEVWKDTFNESRYLPRAPQVTNGGQRELDTSTESNVRGASPPDDHHSLAPVMEPALQLTFSNPPKNPEIGYLLGSDKEICDVFLGSWDDAISPCMFSISFNQFDEVILQSSSTNKTQVSYSIDGTKEVTRENFTWTFPPEVQNIHVTVAHDGIQFFVVVPTHEKDKADYDANCQEFKKLAHSANHTSSQPGILLARGTATPQATAEPPFYLRTAKIGDGGFGVVYRARSMPHGGLVAVKTFKSKDTWQLEADILKKLSEIPHDNIVKFVDFQLGETPQLVMGFAPGGNLEEQYKYRRFTIREVTLILRQMLDALVYLHVEFNIMHRDIKPANILCDSRTHFRLADFGLAKEGDVLRTLKGTLPFMAPEMFTNKPYTAAVDLWALGMVIARFLSVSSPESYKGTEGFKWCEAYVAHFKKHEERCKAHGVSEPNHIRLTVLVRKHMLKIKPKKRLSAPDCLEQGNLLWKMLDEVSNDSGKPLQKEDTRAFLQENAAVDEESGVSEEDSGSEGTKNEPSAGHEPSKDNDSEAETVKSGERTPNSNDWLSLERQFPMEKANGEDNEGRSGSAQHFVYPNSADEHINAPEQPATADSNGHSESNPSQHNEGDLAATGVQEQLLKRKRSCPSGSERETETETKGAAAPQEMMAKQSPESGSRFPKRGRTTI